MTFEKAADPNSREIRVFLSSTFRDFNEERKLLATQVFPDLNRRARERGVELVEVDLRWGVTQAQAEDGHALEICLTEIERCKRYFIGMLGDSYGSLTPPERQLLAAAPDLLEKREWLKGMIGAASYTELEIEQRLQQMGGSAGDDRAFFYFRDPAHSKPMADAGEIGWRSDDPDDRNKLDLLRKRIRNSGYPLVEGLADPQAIADQIKADLWALIDRQFPEGAQPNALQKEARKHADYRQGRCKPGQYIGGDSYIKLLEEWLEQGQQQILITGESGAGKSALIANWMEQHSKSNPTDVVYAHHLGCTNDANALRPLLGRLIDTASVQLLEAGLITEALAVPEDWWELVAKVAETLQSLGLVCKQNGQRWILVLDGLDRLDLEDQQALAWLPQNLPENVFVITSALICPVRQILSERRYLTLIIKPLEEEQQEQLIQSYLVRYTKELDGGLRQQIIKHPLAGSPLFLKVLLEELRQCGRHDTLKSQLAFYLSSKSVDDLYERVLERLENDGSGDVVRKVLTAIWASRAGLAETELLEITELARLQWTPIDLALEKAFGRNGNRLVFDHDYLRIAVEDRYLPTEEQKLQAHEELANWFLKSSRIDLRVAEELPWQLLFANLTEKLTELLIEPQSLSEILLFNSNREVADLWNRLNHESQSIDELLEPSICRILAIYEEVPCIDINGLIRIASLLDEMGLHRTTGLKLRQFISVSCRNSSVEKVEAILSLADAYHKSGMWNEALLTYESALKIAEDELSKRHRLTLTIINNLGNVHSDLNDDIKAMLFYEEAFELRKEELGFGHPDTLKTMNNLANIYSSNGEMKKAEDIYVRAVSIKRNLLGNDHCSTLNGLFNLAIFYDVIGNKINAEEHYKLVLERRRTVLGKNHRDTLMAYHAYGVFLAEQGNQEAAEECISIALEGLVSLFGAGHPDSVHVGCGFANLKADRGDLKGAEKCYKNLLNECLLFPRQERRLNSIRFCLAGCLTQMGKHEEAIEHRRLELAWCREQNGPDQPGTLESMSKLAWDLQQIENYEEAKLFYVQVLEFSENAENKNTDEIMTARYRLAGCLSQMGKHEEAIEHRRLELAWCREQNTSTNPGTLTSINGLAFDLHENGELEEAQTLFHEFLESRQQVLEPEDFQIGRALGGLAKIREATGKMEEALTYCQQAFDHRLEHEGPDSWWTNKERLALARLLHKSERSDQSLLLLFDLLTSMKQLTEPDEDDRSLITEAEQLIESIRLGTGANQ